MLTSLILATLVQSPPIPPAGPRVQVAPDKITSMADTADKDDNPRKLGRVGLGGGPAGAPFGLTITTPMAFGVGLGGRAPVIEMFLSAAGTSWDESFILQLPKVKTLQPQPLLMFFHKFGSLPSDPYNNTGFPAECVKRNWFLFSALGATKKSFSSIESQVNRDEAFGWVMDMFGSAIDQERIYGVGFSMGGGSVTNYAARHLDPNGVRLAAIVDHTGGVSKRYTWQVDPAVRFILDFWFGGNPVQAPFQYQRASVIEFDKTTFEVSSDVSMAWNLTHIPTLVTHADQDPLVYLINQSVVFKDFLSSIGGTVVYELQSGTTHEWKTLKATTACNFLSAFSLARPSSGHTLADNDGAFFAFDIKQDFVNAFTTFDWAVDASKNRISLTGTKNLKSADISTVEAGLNPKYPLQVVLSSGDFFADNVKIDGYRAMPTQVLRDGLPTFAWNWDPIEGAVSLFEQDLSQHNWEIQP